MNDQISKFIQMKKSRVIESNDHEFIDTDSNCARANTKAIDRNQQMQLAVVDNKDGPLAKSIDADSKEVEHHPLTMHLCNNVKFQFIRVDSGVVERLENLEDFLFKARKKDTVLSDPSPTNRFFDLPKN